MCMLTHYQPYSIGDSSLLLIVYSNIPWIKLCWVSIDQTGHRTALSHPKYVHHSNHTHSLTSIWSRCSEELTHSSRKLALNTGIGGYIRWEDCFLGPFMLKSRQMAYPAPTKGFHGQAQTQPCCLHPLGAPTHLPLSHPFLDLQNLSPKDIAGCDIMKLKVSWHIYVDKGLS